MHKTFDFDMFPSLDFPLLFQGTAYPIQTAGSTERVIANCMNRTEQSI
jgi:hypothetical protein